MDGEATGERSENGSRWGKEGGDPRKGVKVDEGYRSGYLLCGMKKEGKESVEVDY